jgi:hypothetical protein
VTGGFTSANSVAANYIAYWNGTTFVALSTGLNAGGVALIIDNSNNVYVAGSFTTAGGTTVNYITKWNGSAFSALGSGMDAAPRDVVIDPSGNVYAGGAFTTAGGVTVNYVAVWNGSAWYALSTGVSGGTQHVNNLAIDENGFLWVGGDFTSAGGLTLTDAVAIWNGTSFVHVDIDLPASTNIYHIEIVEGNVYLGTDTSGTAASSVDTTVTNSGSGVAWPVLEIWNEGGSISSGLTYFKNETTGHTFWMNYELQVEERITINFNPNHFSVVSDRFGDVGYMILGGSGKEFYLDEGSNIITCFTPDAAVTAGLSWRISHESVDGVAA